MWFKNVFIYRSLNNIDLDTFCSYIQKKKKIFNKILGEYCRQPTHKVTPHEVNFLNIPKLIDESKHMAVIQKFSDMFKTPNDDDVPVIDKVGFIEKKFFQTLKCFLYSIKMCISSK